MFSNVFLLSAIFVVAFCIIFKIFFLFLSKNKNKKQQKTTDLISLNDLIEIKIQMKNEHDDYYSRF